MSIPTNTLLDRSKPLRRPGRTVSAQNPRPRRNRVRTRWIDRAFIWVLFGAMLCTAGKNVRGQNVPEPTHYQADAIIYGGTSAAVTAAVQATRMGESVIMVSPDDHLGGLSSGGLGFIDTGNKEVIGGLSREFYHRVYQHYRKPEAWKWQDRSQYGNRGQGTPAIDKDRRTMWIFEPLVAEAVFDDFVRDHGITVLRDEWLDRKDGVVVADNRIAAFETLSGKSFEGKMFIDATYEADLMAAAGVSYHVGREANSVYNEEWNGVQTGVYHHPMKRSRKIITSAAISWHRQCAT